MDWDRSWGAVFIREFVSQSWHSEDQLWPFRIVFQFLWQACYVHVYRPRERWRRRSSTLLSEFRRARVSLPCARRSSTATGTPAPKDRAPTDSEMVNEKTLRSTETQFVKKCKSRKPHATVVLASWIDAS